MVPTPTLFSLSLFGLLPMVLLGGKAYKKAMVDVLFSHFSRGTNANNPVVPHKAFPKTTSICSITLFNSSSYAIIDIVHFVCVLCK